MKRFLLSLGVVCLFSACAGTDDAESVRESQQAQQFTGQLHDPACFTPGLYNLWDWTRKIASVYPAGQRGRPCSGFLFGTKNFFATDARCAPKRGEPLPSVVFGRERALCDTPGSPIIEGVGYEVLRVAEQQKGVAVFELGGNPVAERGFLEIEYGDIVIGERLDLFQSTYWDGEVTLKMETHNKCLPWSSDDTYIRHTCTSAGSHPDPSVFEESFGSPLLRHGWRWVLGVHVESSNVPGVPSRAVRVDAIRSMLDKYL